MERSRSIGVTLAIGGALLALGMVGGAASRVLAQAQDSSTASGWQSHKQTFDYLGISPTYSCDGLENGLTFLLQQSGARLNQPVHAYPCGNYGAPNKLLTATLDFSTLAPAQSGGAGSQVTGVWRHVEFSPQHSSPQLQGGDCELVEEFRDKVLSQFTTRNVQSNLHCVPHQTTGHLFSLTFDVLAAGDASSRAVGGAD